MTRQTSKPLPWVDPEDFFVAHAAQRTRAFWLDGAGARAWSGSRSYVGWLDDDEPSLVCDAAAAHVCEHVAGGVRAVGDDIFEVLAGRVGEADARWVGYLGYAARRDLPAQHGEAVVSAPDACWMRARRWVEFDHSSQSVRAAGPSASADSWTEKVRGLLSSTLPAAEPAAPPPARVVPGLDQASYAAAFEAVQRQLRLGNSYETNLTFRSTVESDAPAIDTYRRLRRMSPAPYAAFVQHHGLSVLSSSPERFVSIDADRRIETRPIKGTTARCADPVADAEAAERLRSETKFLGENLMIVDLLRNDLSRVCEVGTVQVTDLMHVESYPTVHQLISTIEGRLRDDVTTVEAVRALFPGGSMTGAPKERTMRVIADIEQSPRGVYAGAIGWLDDDGRADLGIVIRTLVHRDGRYVLGTGGGITVRSDVDEEYAEASWKVAQLLRSLGIDDPALR